jgi:hypothetical protein
VLVHDHYILLLLIIEAVVVDIRAVFHDTHPGYASRLAAVAATLGGSPATSLHVLLFDALLYIEEVHCVEV